jgi:hypothetical protein
LLINVFESELSYLSHATDGFITGLGWTDEVADDHRYQRSIEDVGIWYPRQESLEGLETGSDQ